ncbi:MAG: allantoinase AllB [Gemmatimonadota bacterium]
MPGESRVDLVVTSRRLILPDGERSGAVVVAGGVIQEIQRFDAALPALRRVDAGNAIVMAGGVDTHVHINEPGTDWEGFETATRAAAAGGITTLVDMPLNSLPVTTTVAALEAKARAAAGRCHVDYGFWGGIIPGTAPHVAPLLDAGVLGFKAFFAPSGLPEFPPVTAADLRPVLPALRARGAPLLVHAEAPGTLACALSSSGLTEHPRSYAHYLASRPARAETVAVRLLIQLAATFGARFHVVHLSSGNALAALGAARRRGALLTVETCPHYLTFAAEEIGDGETACKCAPPIRERAERERLWAGLRSGAIDLVASDHSPCPPEWKRLASGSFLDAWGGISSLQLVLPAVWTGARARGFLPADVTRWLSRAPARLAGLEGRKGALAPGCDADLVIWEPEGEFVVDPAALHHRHALSPYAGRRLAGRVRQTFLRGRLIYDDGAFPAPPGGEWIRRAA